MVLDNSSRDNDMYWMVCGDSDTLMMIVLIHDKERAMIITMMI